MNPGNLCRLSDAAARRLLTTAFCHAVTNRVEGRGLAGRIAELLDFCHGSDMTIDEGGNA